MVNFNDNNLFLKSQVKKWKNLAKEISPLVFFFCKVDITYFR